MTSGMFSVPVPSGGTSQRSAPQRQCGAGAAIHEPAPSSRTPVPTHTVRGSGGSRKPTRRRRVSSRQGPRSSSGNSSSRSATCRPSSSGTTSTSQKRPAARRATPVVPFCHSCLHAPGSAEAAASHSIDLVHSVRAM
ncbi:hypothetical protein ACFY9X_01185 [Streptomyces nigra]|uniref:hypothetical protein n=1 Tax=Streptomyces nigra TaxID=1827580 RepID=UPI0036E965B3